MATQTTNYNLVKPALTDSPPDITVMNPNWDKIDSELKINSSAIGQIAVDLNKHKSETTSYACYGLASATSIPTGIYTTLPLSNVSVDSGNSIIFNYLYIKILKSGKYNISVKIALSPSNIGGRRIGIYKNNELVETVLCSAVSDDGYGSMETSVVMDSTVNLLENDILDIRIYQTSGATINTIPDPRFSNVVLRRFA